MNKKAGFILLFLLVMSSFLVSAADNSSVETKAAACLENKVNGKCSSLSTEEKIFSLLSIGRCQQELVADKSDSGCWPEGDCNVKITAQAILALEKYNIRTSDAQEWLISKSSNFSSDITWYLQVDVANGSDCYATYGGGTKEYEFEIGEDKVISGSALKCLTVYEDFWLKVNPTCYGDEIKVSCEDSFTTSTFFKRKTSQMVYVLDGYKSASGEGTTTEIVSSSCFKEGKVCNYEGTLWASIVLKALGKDVSGYVPYLISMAEDNEKYIPESFLYILTGKYDMSLLEKQKEDQWWAESGDKFYDTAVALLPFQSDNSITEKANSKAWLESVQSENGCWQDNVRNTAFLLYSLWSDKANLSSSEQDCESSNYFCRSESSCSGDGGSVLTGFGGCSGLADICCNKEEELYPCDDLGGKLCTSEETCTDGTRVSSSDSVSGLTCCVEGSCEEQTTTTDNCVSSGGTCRISCFSGESSSSDSCSGSSYQCCVEENNPTIPWILILVLGILILLVIFGILFKDKIRALLFTNKKNKANKGNPTQQNQNNPRFPPTSSSQTYPGAVQRRILPPQQMRQQPIVKGRVQDKTEFDDVLKKLKEIGE